MIHPVLARQLKRIGLSPEEAPDAAGWAAMLDRVSRAYTEAEEDRYTLERSLAISSKEMRGLYDDLQRSSETQLAIERDKLEKSVAVLRATQDAVIDGILVIDAAGRLVAHNRRFTEIWSVPPEVFAADDRDVLLAHCLPVVSNTEEVLARVAYLAERPHERSFDEVRFHDGRVLERYSGPVMSAQGAVYGRIWIFRDITDRRRAEEANQRLNLELEHRVAERTCLLAAANRDLDANLTKLHETQEELVQSGKMAAIGTLVAGLSHELNNPIGIIYGFTQSLLRRASPEDPARAALGAIERQAERCATLVRALLDFSRRDGGDGRVTTPVEKLIRCSLDLIEGQTRRRRVSLEIDCADGLPELDVCPAEIETAILNVVGNALDETQAGGRIQVSAARVARGARRGVEISIADEGGGIPAEVLPRIFDPFFTTKPPGRGTGLGLSLTRQIVERHGGDIRVESGPGVGTVMRLWLPSSAGRSRPAPVLDGGTRA